MLIYKSKKPEIRRWKSHDNFSCLLKITKASLFWVWNYCFVFSMTMIFIHLTLSSLFLLLSLFDVHKASPSILHICRGRLNQVHLRKCSMNGRQLSCDQFQLTQTHTHTYATHKFYILRFMGANTCRRRCRWHTAINYDCHHQHTKHHIITWKLFVSFLLRSLHTACQFFLSSSFRQFKY